MRLDNQNREAGKKRRFFTLRNFIFLSVIILGFAFFFASVKLKSKGYSGVWDFVSTVSSNYVIGSKAQPDELSISIKDQDFKKLEKLRKQALARGVIINELDGDYVPAELEFNGKKVEVKLRLKGHMTDHLQNNKWSFRVKAKGKGSFMGMKRFSIQHPGTRGYIYEWIYHELMKREDIIALRYKFIKVKVNGSDWGIYAVEENFENELVENNNRIKAPILRYNPDLYWVNRYNMTSGMASDDEFASYYSANPEAYRENKVLGDSLQKQYYMKAIALLEGMRSRKISVDQGFDINRLAKFHAIIDLVGGVHSIDWSDIKYYYNPVTGKLEPVAYESFTNLQSRNISSAYKFVTADSSGNYRDWHEMIFSNKKFFSQYISELERMIQPEYLDEFFSDSNEELKKNLAIIYKEFPYKKFDRNHYYKRQALLRNILNSPKAIHAYLYRREENVVYLQIAPIDVFPIDIISVNSGSSQAKIVKSTVLPSKQHQKSLEYFKVSFAFPSGSILNDSLLSGLTINYRIPGSSLIKKAKVFPFPHTDSEFLANDLTGEKGNVSDFNFLKVDEENKTIISRAGNHTVSKTIVIPAGYQWITTNNCTFDFKNKSGVVSFSPLNFKGSEDEHLIIASSDSSWQGIKVIGVNKLSDFQYVTFQNLPALKKEDWKRKGALTFYESPVSFIGCSFYQCTAPAAIQLIRSEYLIKGVYFGRIRGNALDIDYSKGLIENSVIEDCTDIGIDLRMSDLKLSKTSFIRTKKALKISEGSKLNAGTIIIKNGFIGIASENHSEGAVRDLKIFDAEFGIVTTGSAELVIKSGEFVNVSKICLKEKKASLTINGESCKEVVKDADLLTQNGKKSKE